MYFIGIIMTAFVMLVVGIVIGYMGSKREAEELRKTLRDARIELGNLRLGYTNGDKNI